MFGVFTLRRLHALTWSSLGTDDRNMFYLV